MPWDSGHVSIVHGTTVCGLLALLELLDMAWDCTVYMVVFSLLKMRNAFDNPSPWVPPIESHDSTIYTPGDGCGFELTYADTLMDFGYDGMQHADEPGIAKPWIKDRDGLHTILGDVAASQTAAAPRIFGESIRVP